MKVDYIYCSYCGFEGIGDVEVSYSRQTANGEWYICPECGDETSNVEVDEL